MNFNLEPKSGSHGNVSPASQSDVKPHITKSGKQGKMLRKKLALSLGVRTSSSAGSSTSTTSPSEEEPEQTPNVLELFRKHVKLTASQRRQMATSNTEQQDEYSSISTQETVHRRTRTGLNEFRDTEDRDVYQERSKDQTVMRLEHKKHEITNSRHSTQEQTQKTNTTSSQSDRVVNRTTASLSDNGITTTLDVNATHTTPTEDIFSSFGEQNDTQTTTVKPLSHDRTAKHLREKIRTNARARKLPKPTGVGVGMNSHQAERNLTDQSAASSRNDVENQSNISINRQTERQISSSQIPVRVGKKSDEGETFNDQLRKYTKGDVNENDTSNDEITRKNSLQKSKIPRRKSQNSADGTRTTDSGFESSITEVLSNSTNDFEIQKNQKRTEKSLDSLDIDAKDKVKYKEMGEDGISVKLTQELQSSFNSEDALFDDGPTSTSSLTDRQIETKNKETPDQTLKNKLTDILTKHKSLDVIRQSFTTTKTEQRKPTDPPSISSFDKLEAELAKLKAKVSSTYDEFREMNDFTLALRKDLKQIRNI